MSKKISLIGAGQIGGTLAHLIGLKELANEVARNQNHVNDLNNKLATNLHVNEQLSATLEIFNEKHQQGVKELKKAMESAA